MTIHKLRKGLCLAVAVSCCFAVAACREHHPTMQKSPAQRGAAQAQVVKQVSVAKPTTTTSHPAIHKQKVSYLFVMTAGHGRLSKAPNGYHLVLYNTNPHVLWFTDRPNRQSGYIKVRKFLNQWSANFKDSQPNAAIAHAFIENDSKNEPKPEAVELINPRTYKGSILFDVKALSQSSLRTGKIHHVMLFIDNATMCYRGSCGTVE